MIYHFFSKSQAYLDPGSGSYFIQILIAGLAGGVTLISIYWEKIKGLFSKKSRSDDTLKQNSEKIEDE